MYEAVCIMPAQLLLNESMRGEVAEALSTCADLESLGHSSIAM